MREAVKLIYLSLAIILFSRCTDDDDLRVFTLNQKLEIAQEDIIRVDIEQGDRYVEVQVLEITDSRCPSDLRCFRAGEAEVRVALNGQQEKPTLVDLCIGDCPQNNQGYQEVDTVEVTLDNTAYALILSNVLPFPTTTNQSLTKQACLRMTTR